MAEAIVATTPAQAEARLKCEYCNGRGWYVGECHPAELCGGCDGMGTVLATSTTSTTASIQGVPGGGE